MHPTGRARQLVKTLLFPGVDPHLRSRYRHIAARLLPGPIDTLDAGCGYGALAYAAYRRGNRVVAVTNREQEIEKNLDFYGRRGVDPERLRFELEDLYDLRHYGESAFDQVICSEVLEHITDDAAVVANLAAVLRPGGIMHVCCPNAEHPEHALGRHDEPEDGRHVRDGYTVESYRALLEPAGFVIEDVVGIGSPAVAWAGRACTRVNDVGGTAAAVPVVVATLPVRYLDRREPAVPFSLYARARRVGPSVRSPV